LGWICIQPNKALGGGEEGGSLAGRWLHNRAWRRIPHRVARAPYGKEKIEMRKEKKFAGTSLRDVLHAP